MNDPYQPSHRGSIRFLRPSTLLATLVSICYGLIVGVSFGIEYVVLIEMLP